MELLSDDKMTMRSAGVRVLENLAEGATEDSNERNLVCHILTDFVCEQSAAPFATKLGVPDIKTCSDAASREKRKDIEIALKSLGRVSSTTIQEIGYGFEKAPMDATKKTRLVSRRYNIDLANVDLSWLHLDGLNLWGAKLRNVFLSNTRCNRANISRCLISNGMMSRIQFRDATLDDAIFSQVSLEKANFNSTKLRRCLFMQVDLSGASFYQADATGTVFAGASLAETTNLVLCKFLYADLGGNILSSLPNPEFLIGADLSGVNLQKFETLTQRHLDKIIFQNDRPPLVPEQFRLPKERAYERNEKDFRYYFVESNWEYSGYSVNDWRISKLDRILGKAKDDDS